MNKLVTLGAFLAVVWVCGVYAAAPTYSFNFDLTKPTTPFPHYWEQCVGSGHATLGLRADWRDYLTRAHNDCGFEMVRFHGVLDDDMSTYTTVNGAPGYSFFNVDSVYDFLVSIGMKPLIELSFMPELIASGNTTVFHYEGNTTPPTNYSQWAEVIQTFVKHLVQRYGIEEVRTWPFEVWNEPNCGFWSGTQQEYFTLYNYTAHAIKNVDSLLLVGGPATCQSQWIPEFLNYTSTHNIPVDFVSTHEYPTDITPTYRDVMTDVVTTARKQAGNLPLYYTEYNDGLYSDPPYHDTSYASAFIVKNINDLQGLVQLFSWWTFSDIFEEQGFSSIPFNDPNGWGLLSRYGIAKPSYRAFQMLHQLGDKRVNVTVTNPSGVTATVEAYAILKDTEAQGSLIDIMISNYNVAGAPIQAGLANITLTGVPASVAPNAGLYIIDEKHVNPVSAWQSLGSPAYPTRSQLEIIDVASQLQRQTIHYQRINNNTIQFQLNIQPQGVARIELSLV